MSSDIDIVTAISQRRSVRSFHNKALSAADDAFVRDLISELSNTAGPCGTHVRMVFGGPGSGDSAGESAASGKVEIGSKVGTYGVIRGARSFVGAVVENTPESMLDLGYLFERLVIELTARGLGTCWLGGTFDRKSFAADAGLAPGEILPIITPVGYPAERPGLQDRFMRSMAGSDRRKPFEELFFNGSFETPLVRTAPGTGTASSNGTGSEPWLNALELVRIGPSASNKQPWRVVLAPAGGALQPSTAHLYLSRTPGYIGNKLGFDIQRVDIGIAMYHFEAGMAAGGLPGRWTFHATEIALDSEIDPGIGPSFSHG